MFCRDDHFKEIFYLDCRDYTSRYIVLAILHKISSHCKETLFYQHVNKAGIREKLAVIIKDRFLLSFLKEKNDLNLGYKVSVKHLQVAQKQLS